MTVKDGDVSVERQMIKYYNALPHFPKLPRLISTFGIPFYIHTSTLSII